MQSAHDTFWIMHFIDVDNDEIARWFFLFFDCFASFCFFFVNVPVVNIRTNERIYLFDWLIWNRNACVYVTNGWISAWNRFRNACDDFTMLGWFHFYAWKNPHIRDANYCFFFIHKTILATITDAFFDFRSIFLFSYAQLFLNKLYKAGKLHFELLRHWLKTIKQKMKWKENSWNKFTSVKAIIIYGRAHLRQWKKFAYKIGGRKRFCISHLID